MTVWGLFIVVAAVAACVRILPENQRLAIFKSGQVVGIRGPGIVMVLPVLERGVRIDLDRDIPGWRSMPAAELSEQIRMHVTL